MLLLCWLTSESFFIVVALLSMFIVLLLQLLLVWLLPSDGEGDVLIGVLDLIFFKFFLAYFEDDGAVVGSTTTAAYDADADA